MHISTKRILIVEDQRVIAGEIHQKLTHFGYEVIGTADTGELAVRLAREKRPALILMDIHLKGSIDGIETANEIHAFIDVPIIYLTADIDDDTLKRAHITAPYGYLVKPFEAIELRSAIEAALYHHEMEMKLREIAAFNQAITNTVPDFISVLDLYTQTDVFQNMSVVEHLGYQISASTHTDADSKPFFYVHPADEDKMEAYFSRLGQRGNLPCSIEYRALKKSGEVAWLHRRDVSFKTDEAGRVTHLLVVTGDITARKQAEEQCLENQRQIELLKHIIHAALESEDLNGLLNTLVAPIANLIHANNCFITLWDERLQEPILVAASGLEEKRCEHIQDLALNEAVMRAGQPIFVEDVQSSPLINQATGARLPCRSLLGLLLHAGEENLGVVWIGFRETPHLTQADLTNCKRAAEAVSLAIAKMRLLDETRQRAAEMESLDNVASAMRAAPDLLTLLSVILNLISKLFHADDVAIILHNPERKQNRVDLAIGHWQNLVGQIIPPGKGICWQVIATGQPRQTSQVINRDLGFELYEDQQFDATACLPLIAKNTPFGALLIGRSTSISAEDMNRLATFTTMAANAINRQTLHENLQEQYKELKVTPTRKVFVNFLVIGFVS